jgi:hypothetical protein
MTSDTRLRFAMVILYTMVVAGAAFGVGYAVFELGDDGGETGNEITQQNIEQRIDALTAATLDRFEGCEPEFTRLFRLIGQVLADQLSGSALERELRIAGAQLLACGAI